MDKYSSILLLLTVTATLAIPTGESSPSSHVLERSRRDMSGIFDSITNGIDGLATSIKSVSKSIADAFNSIFSTSNKNAISDGFSKFQKGLKDGFNGLFGSNGEITKGVKKVGDKIKGHFTGEGGEHKEGEHKEEGPAGEVPAEETT